MHGERHPIKPVITVLYPVGPFYHLAYLTNTFWCPAILTLVARRLGTINDASVIKAQTLCSNSKRCQTGKSSIRIKPWLGLNAFLSHVLCTSLPNTNIIHNNVLCTLLILQGTISQRQQVACSFLGKRGICCV